MKKTVSRRRFLLAGLFLLMTAAGCEAGGDVSTLPTAPQPLLGGLLGGGGGGGGTLGGYKLANDNIVPALLNQPLKLTQIIGANGGTIQLLGHKLVVPQGAVLSPTLFTLNVLPSGYVEVYLTATLSDLLAGILNVGAQGFSTPVKVTLTYSRSTNVPNPSKLIVLRAKGANGLPEALPTVVDLQAKTVTADLDHFSRYFIAFPN